MWQGWLLLLGAIVLEVAGTTSMKLSDGFSRWLPSVLIFVFYGASFTLLTYTLKKMEISMAYSVWAGLGTALIAAIGIVFFQEGMSWVKLLGIFLVIVGIILINHSGVRH